MPIHSGPRSQNDAEVSLAGVFKQTKGCVGIRFVDAGRIFHRPGDTHHGGFVEDDVNILGKSLQYARVSDIRPVEGCSLGEIHLVTRREVIDDVDVIVGSKPSCEVVAHEPGTSRDENPVVFDHIHCCGVLPKYT
jgi:hypothetical protein